MLLVRCYRSVALLCLLCLCSRCSACHRCAGCLAHHQHPYVRGSVCSPYTCSSAIARIRFPLCPSWHPCSALATHINCHGGFPRLLLAPRSGHLSNSALLAACSALPGSSGAPLYACCNHPHLLSIYQLLHDVFRCPIVLHDTTAPSLVQWLRVSMASSTVHASSLSLSSSWLQKLSWMFIALSLQSCATLLLLSLSLFIST